MEPCARPGALLCVPSPCIVILGFPQFKRHNSGNGTTKRAQCGGVGGATIGKIARGGAWCLPAPLFHGAGKNIWDF